jgi:hypothetical protein
MLHSHSSLPPLRAIVISSHRLLFLSFSLHPPCPSRMPSPVSCPVTNNHLRLSLSCRLATFARIQAKNHSVARSPHARSGSPALTSSLVMRAYTATITAPLLLAGLVKKTRCPYPLLMAGTMMMPHSPGEPRKRRLGAEQTATMRCVLRISSLASLQPSNA